MSDRPHCHGDVCITCSDEAVQVRVVRLLEADLAVVDTGQSMEEVSVVLVDAAAPEVTAVEVENLTRERRQQLLQIQPLYTECAVPAAAAGTDSDLGRVAAFYPSPAGATESLLPLEALAEVVAANPVMTDLGLVRMHWKGCDGGQEAWEAIDGFFDAVRERSRVP